MEDMAGRGGEGAEWESEGTENNILIDSAVNM